MSEGRDAGLLSALSLAAASVPGATCAHTFTDEEYNRTGYTLVAASSAPLEAAARALCAAALCRADLRTHAASHPRLGVIDHVAVHPLGCATLDAPAALARALGAALGRQMPVFFYGAAHPEGRTLADTRRGLGYFQGQAADIPAWVGSPSLGPIGAAAGPGADAWKGTHHEVAPDCGLSLGSVNPAWGVALVGATPWVVNFNLLLSLPSLHDKADAQSLGAVAAAARRVARAVSQRGGGLPGVQARNGQSAGVFEAVFSRAGASCPNPVSTDHLSPDR